MTADARRRKSYSFICRIKGMQSLHKQGPRWTASGSPYKASASPSDRHNNTESPPAGCPPPRAESSEGVWQVWDQSAVTAPSFPATLTQVLRRRITCMMITILTDILRWRQASLQSAQNSCLYPAADGVSFWYSESKAFAQTRHTGTDGALHSDNTLPEIWRLPFRLPSPFSSR